LSALLRRMALSERIHGVAARGVALATDRRVRVAAQVLLLAGLVFVALRLRSIWRDSHVRVDQISWDWLVGAVVLSVGAIVGSGFIWVSILERLGLPARARWIGIYLQAQLGKYIPGSLWQYAGRGALAQTYGVSIRAVARALPIEVVAMIYAAGAFSILLVGWWGIVGVVAALAAAPLFVRRLRRNQVEGRAAVRAARLFAITWPVFGVGFWMTARGFISIPASDLAYFTGAFAAAWVVGFVAVYAPGGLGVREAILVALLRGKIGSADAVLVAVASRGVLTLADVVGAGIGSAVLRRGRAATDSVTARQPL